MEKQHRISTRTIAVLALSIVIIVSSLIGVAFLWNHVSDAQANYESAQRNIEQVESDLDGGLRETIAQYYAESDLTLEEVRHEYTELLKSRDYYNADEIDRMAERVADIRAGR